MYNEYSDRISKEGIEEARLNVKLSEYKSKLAEIEEGRHKTSRQEIWIDVDQDTHEYDCEIHIHGKDLYEVIEGMSIIQDKINRLNGLN